MSKNGDAYGQEGILVTQPQALAQISNSALNARGRAVTAQCGAVDRGHEDTPCVLTHGHAGNHQTQTRSEPSCSDTPGRILTFYVEWPERK